jgi:hypothetical protein
MRTRETELAERFPVHVVCEWIGNSQPVAVKHYLQITEEHFARALDSAAKSDAQSGCDVALQPAMACEVVQECRIRPEGFEPPTYGSEDHCSIQLSYGRLLRIAVVS